MSMSEVYQAYPFKVEPASNQNPCSEYRYPFINQYSGAIDCMMQNITQKSNTTKSKVKTSLCKKWAETGHCPYGMKCQFAHGIQQLRCNVDQNSYKTKPCNAFFKKGYCQYGNRCNFSHKQIQNILTETEQKTENTNLPKIVGYQEVLKQGLIAKEGSSRLLKNLNQCYQVCDEKSENSTEDCKSDSLSGSRSSLSQIKYLNQQFQNRLEKIYLYNSCGDQLRNLPSYAYGSYNNQTGQLGFSHYNPQLENTSNYTRTTFGGSYNFQY